MLQKSITILLLILSMCMAFTGDAQQGFYVPKSGTVFFYGDTATIFSNVLNQGVLGVGGKAILNFKGQVWENDRLATITDTTGDGYGVNGKGGVVKFSGDLGRQKLIGGYNAASRTGPVFSKFEVQNKFGVEMEWSSAKVWNEFVFSRGLFYLKGNIMVVGNNQPGIINGYDSTKFFVTAPQAGGGMLLRENMGSADGKIVFPVGTRSNAYAPAAIQNYSTQPDDFFVNVFDGVQQQATSGSSINEKSVNKTWHIGKINAPNQGNVEVHLQHLVSEEGVQFSVKRWFAYISKFSGTAWDEGFPQITPQPGNMTSNGPLTGSGVNSRNFYGTIGTDAYFTKFAGDKDTSLKTKLHLTAYRVNSSIVNVNWRTNPEINVKQFVIERRLSNEANFKVVDSVKSMAVNGLSFSYLSYADNDSNNYKGVSFYRLNIFDYFGNAYYSNVVAVNGAGFNTMVIWPNPASDRFNMIINSPIAKAIVIHNVLGQKMYTKVLPATGQNFIEVNDHRLIPGTYFVSIVDQANAVIHTEKLVILR